MLISCAHHCIFCGIDWTVRYLNPTFWVQLVIAVSSPVFAYYGITPKDLKTWCNLFDFIKQAFSNPYVVGLIIINVANTITDPTTKGLSD
jgi:phi LC3 family holin